MAIPEPAARARNKALYGDLWQHYHLFPHDAWSAWPEIEPFSRGARRLEIGPGMLPHLPMEGTTFIDLSAFALRSLAARGGRSVRGADPLPFRAFAFDLACMFEVIEHVDDDARLLAEIARVLRPGGVLFLSCPMNPAYWTAFDAQAGHVQRYTGDRLRSRLEAAGFAVERVCARDDRMDRWFGWLFAFGVRRLPRLTARIIEHYLPPFAATPWAWKDGADFSEAERRGGVTVRARKL
jgi:SAM-dependent methyltransferase